MVISKEQKKCVALKIYLVLNYSAKHPSIWKLFNTYDIELIIANTVEQCKNKPAAQAAGQTLPDATPPVSKIHQFSKIFVTFETIQRF